MIRTLSAAVAAALSSSLLIATADVATAAQIKILAGSAIETAMAVLISQFEQSSGHKVAFDFNGAIGAMTDRVQEGEAADVVVVSGPQIEMLERQGKVASGSRADMQKSASAYSCERALRSRTSARSMHSNAQCWPQNQSDGTIQRRERQSAYT